MRKNKDEMTIRHYWINRQYGRLSRSKVVAFSPKALKFDYHSEQLFLGMYRLDVCSCPFFIYLFFLEHQYEDDNNINI